MILIPVLRLVATAAVFGGVALVPAAAAPSSDAPETFGITGDADGLFPGSSATIDAQVTNPEAFTIRTTSLGALVGDASAACPARFLTVDESHASVLVPPASTAPMPLLVRMDRAAPDTCQGATFSLQLSGTAVEATVATDPSPTPLATTGTAVATLVGAALVLIGGGAAIRRIPQRPGARAQSGGSGRSSSRQCESW
jgi:hypothetical protein